MRTGSTPPTADRPGIGYQESNERGGAASEEIAPLGTMTMTIAAGGRTLMRQSGSLGENGL